MEFQCRINSQERGIRFISPTPKPFSIILQELLHHLFRLYLGKLKIGYIHSLNMQRIQLLICKNINKIYKINNQNYNSISKSLLPHRFQDHNQFGQNTPIFFRLTEYDHYEPSLKFRDSLWETGYDELRRKNQAKLGVVSDEFQLQIKFQKLNDKIFERLAISIMVTFLLMAGLLLIGFMLILASIFFCCAGGSCYSSISINITKHMAQCNER